MTKKMWLIMAILCLTWPSVAMTYTVKSGDTLGEIAKANGVSLFELARINKIRKVNFIRAGQELIISGKSGDVSNEEYGSDYQYPGADSFMGTLDDAKPLLGLSDEEVQLIKDKRSRGDFILGDLNRGDHVKAMVFGKKHRARNFRVKRNFRCAFKKVDSIKVEIYDLGTKNVIRPLICNNWSLLEIRPPKGPVREVFVPEPAAKPCPTCPDQIEIDTGMYLWNHDPGGPGQTIGIGGFEELIYWRNFDPQKCSSQYWWGIGELGSAYLYGATGFPSDGWGGRLALQATLKRTWRNRGLMRQYVLKGRFGWEWSHWENSDQNWNIDQSGPVLGLYGEYRHELRYKKLEAFLTAETWFGLGGQHVSTNLSGTGAASRLFGEYLAGIDYYVTPDDVIRVYAGVDIQGWDGRIPFVPGIEYRHKLANNNGTLSVGLQAKVYSTIAPTGLVYAKWEMTKLLQKKFREERQKEVKLVGQGIGGTQYESKNASVKIDDPFLVSISQKTSSSSVTTGETNNSLGTSGNHRFSDELPDFSGGKHPPGDA